MIDVEERREQINKRGEELARHYMELAAESIPATILASRGQATLEFRVGDLELEVAELKERLA